MIKFVREYTHGKSPELHWDVIHEINGRKRLYYYCESGGGLPKTAQEFIKGKTPRPYRDALLKNEGVTYHAKAE